MPKKSNIPDECIEITKNPIISLEENGKTMIFKNEKRKSVTKIRVDGCAVKDGIRCDWLVKNDKNVEHFVELKGTDVAHGCRQLERSILELSENVAKSVKHSFIIASRLVPAINPTIQIFKRKFDGKYNSSLTVKNRKYECDL